MELVNKDDDNDNNRDNGNIRQWIKITKLEEETTKGNAEIDLRE